ncbi:MAG: hypothetical protein R2778_10580 [Saprospiraceae bacterium]
MAIRPFVIGDRTHGDTRQQGAAIGTPPSIKASEPAQTVAMEAANRLIPECETKRTV